MMTVSRKAFEMVDENTPQRAWVRPAVQRLSAGCAENGTPSGVPDTGVNFS
jgi:hypothetical protein